MPEINPTNHSQPSDWRWAWSEFQKLKAMAHSVGMSTAGWKLEYPSKIKKLADPRWHMTYTIPNDRTVRHIYLGSNGRTAGNTIKSIMPDYKRLVDSQKERIRLAKQKRSQETNDPMYNPQTVREALATWNRIMKTIRSNKDVENFKKRNPNLNKLMNRKAGILNMTLREYLTGVGMSSLFPTPPRTEEELRERQRTYERYMRDMEETERQKKADHERNQGPYPWEESATTDWYG